jgi:hypothetical protein
MQLGEVNPRRTNEWTASTPNPPREPWLSTATARSPRQTALVCAQAMLASCWALVNGAILHEEEVSARNVSISPVSHPHQARGVEYSGGLEAWGLHLPSWRRRPSGRSKVSQEFGWGSAGRDPAPHRSGAPAVAWCQARTFMRRTRVARCRPERSEGHLAPRARAGVIHAALTLRSARRRPW